MYILTFTLLKTLPVNVNIFSTKFESTETGAVTQRINKSYFWHELSLLSTGKTEAHLSAGQIQKGDLNTLEVSWAKLQNTRPQISLTNSAASIIYIISAYKHLRALKPLKCTRATHGYTSRSIATSTSQFSFAFQHSGLKECLFRFFLRILFLLPLPYIRLLLRLTNFSA